MRGSNLARQERRSAPEKNVAEKKRPIKQGTVRKTAGAMQETARFAPVPKPRYYYDRSLLAIIFVTSLFGLLMIYSSSQYIAFMSGKDADYYFTHQAMFVAGGMLAALGISLLNYHWLRYFAKFGILLAIALLLLVLLIGSSGKGAQRWLEIGGVRFQPTEPAKAALIVYLAAKIAQFGPRIGKWRNLRGVLLVSVIPILLVTKENLSSGIIMAGIVFVMLFVACRQWKWFVGLASAGIAAILAAKPLAAWTITRLNLSRPESYHLRRVFGWALPERFPDDAYQTLQGLYAIGSGGLTGQGLGESIQKFGKLPEAQNDMIFTIICEELGFIGAAAVVLLFLCIIYRLMKIAQDSEDLFGSMLCVGIIAHLSIQVILNIAVVTGVIPNTGVTLPFISYGGSAVFFTLIEIGIALSVAHRIRLA